VARAVSGNSAWRHFSALGNELGDRSEIFIIDRQRFIRAKSTHPASKHWSAALTAFIVVRSFSIRSRTSFHLCHISSYLFLQACP
jgi:hypothetical protein